MENMKEKMKNWVKCKGRRCTLWCKKWCRYQFVSASKPLYWISLLLISLEVADKVGRITIPEWIGKTAIVIGCIVIGVIIRFIINWLGTFIFKVKTDNFISILMIIAAIISSLKYFKFRLSNLPEVAIGIVISLALVLFIKSLWSMLRGRRYTKYNIVITTLGIIVIGIGAWFICSGGFEDTYIEKYLALGREQPVLNEVTGTEFLNAIKGGTYTPQSLLYGTNPKYDDLISTTVNLKSYASNKKGVAGYIKKKYQGYDLDAVPLRGKVWYPEEVNQCPTLFIIHGNHDYIEESYLGYDYLGSYLATYGYVVVSIDQNACNLLTQENDARAILLLENMKKIREYNQEEDNPLFNKVDMNALAIAGHSRGGEAVSIAYLFNQEDVSLGNGFTKWDYHFNIKGIIAIAPTIDQYKPVGKSVVLEDVNYMVIHGANDSDLYQFGGMKQYKKINFTGEKPYIKTSLYCAGCNHGQFNTRWGLYDRTGGHQKVLNVKDFISETDQQEIAKIFIKIFLDYTLRNDETHIKLLEDYRLYKKYLPQTLYLQTYQKSDFIPICNFEEDLSLLTGTMDDVHIMVDNGSVWTEGIYPNEASNSSLYISWNNNNHPAVRIKTPPLDITKRALQFDIMDMKEDKENPRLLDAKIIITDKNDESREFSLKDYATIYPAFLVRLNKLQYILGKVDYKHQFQTVTIPVEDMGHIGNMVEIQIIFTDTAGQVAIDEIGI